MTKKQENKKEKKKSQKKENRYTVASGASLQTKTGDALSSTEEQQQKSLLMKNVDALKSLQNERDLNYKNNIKEIRKYFIDLSATLAWHWNKFPKDAQHAIEKIEGENSEKIFRILNPEH